MPDVLLAVFVYGTAAVLDAKTRRVPNVLWIVAGILFTIFTATTASLFGLAVILPCAYFSWSRGEIGGGDVKGLAILPLALPLAWMPVALGAALLTALWFVVRARDEVPLFVPLFGSVLAAASLA